MYTERQYQRIVADVAEESMKAAVEQVKAYPHYATCGEKIVVIFILNWKTSSMDLLLPLPKIINN